MRSDRRVRTAPGFFPLALILVLATASSASGLSVATEAASRDGAPLTVYLGIGLIVVLLGITGTLAWIRWLKREAARRTEDLRAELGYRRQAEEALRESEERYRDVVEITPLLICRFDPDGAITYANDACCSYFGRERGEIRGVNLLEFIPDEVGRSVWDAITTLTPGSPTMTHEHEVIAADGSIRWLRWANRALFDEDGRALVHQSIGEDVTDRRQVEQALRESEARLASIFRAAPIGIGLVVNRVLKQVNDRTCAMLRCEAADLVERSARVLYPDEEEYEFVGREKYIQIREKGTGTVETRWIRKGGEIIDVLLSSTPLDAADLSVGVTFTALDITERKRAERERARLEAQVRHSQKLESLGVLAGGIAHDFNNLLMAILGNADLALSALSSGSPAWTNLKAIEGASRRAAELCRQMLAYSGKGKFVIETLDLSDLVREMANILSVSISKGTVLRYDFAAGIPAIEADPSQVRQIVMNLITNAAEAIEDLSGVIAVSTGTVELSRTDLGEAETAEDLEDGLYVYLEVTDTGCGMDETTRARLYDPFFTTKFQGRGLGLSAVLGIVRGHGGAIQVDSTPGRGSRFRVLLPAASAAAEVRPPVETEDWRGSGTVLLADDEESVRVVAGLMLEKLGFDVMLAEDGRRALEIFRSRAFGFVVVILDLTMPHHGGEECLREIRAIREDVPVVLSSGYSEHDVAERFAGEELAGFIQKPYRMKELTETLRRALG